MACGDRNTQEQSAGVKDRSDPLVREGLGKAGGAALKTLKQKVLCESINAM